MVNYANPYVVSQNHVTITYFYEKKNHIRYEYNIVILHFKFEKFFHRFLEMLIT